MHPCPASHQYLLHSPSFTIFTVILTVQCCIPPHQYPPPPVQHFSPACNPRDGRQTNRGGRTVPTAAAYAALHSSCGLHCCTLHCTAPLVPSLPRPASASLVHCRQSPAHRARLPSFDTTTLPIHHSSEPTAVPSGSRPTTHARPHTSTREAAAASTSTAVSARAVARQHDPPSRYRYPTFPPSQEPSSEPCALSLDIPCRRPLT